MAGPRPTEILRGAQFRGVPSAVMSGGGITQPFVGRTDIVAGDALTVVSCDLVTSNSIILLGTQGSVAANSLAQAINVRTIDPGKSFILGSSDGKDLVRTVTVMWLLIRA